MMRPVCGCLLLFLSACAVVPPSEKPTLTPVDYAALSGWAEDAVIDAIAPFQKSCAVLSKKKAPFFKEEGSGEGWKNICAALASDAPQDNEQARAFFEKNFIPYRVNDGESGLFTGYYEPQLHGSWKKGGRFQTPLYARPRDMLVADLGRFKESLRGQKITGKAEGSAFVPYDDRAAIAEKGLAKRAKPLMWVDDPVDAFFLEIQGSGQVQMKNGEIVRVGYAAQNGHGYTPIGRVLAERGAIEKPVTMQKIHAWLASHPDQMQAIMNTNPSYVFFRKSERDGAVGAQGVVLTPMRSMAVDRSMIPLGVPLWLETEHHKRLVVAQDTGGAIKGAVRGDLFWGAGEAAEEGAGAMQESGAYYILLPKRIEAP